MPQFTRIPINEDDYNYASQEEAQMNFWNDVQQCSQINYRNERVICIEWHTTRNRVLIQDGGNYFFLTSPDIQELTLRHALEALGIDRESISLDWCERDINIHNLLDTPVKTAALNQMTISTSDNNSHNTEHIVHLISINVN